MRRFSLAVVVALACGASPKNVSSPATIRVLVVGAEPRHLIRYELAPSAPVRIEIEMAGVTIAKVTNTVLETGTRRTELPRLRVLARLETEEILANGDARMGMVIEDIVLLEAVSSKRAANLTRSKGTHMSWRTSARGEESALTVDGDPRVKRQVESWLPAFQRVVFPDAPIGLGATWEVTRHVRMWPVTWTARTRYTLEHLVDGTAELGVDTKLTAERQALHVEPNRTTTLTSGTGTSVGKILVDLHGAAITGTVTTATEGNFSIVERALRITSTILAETVLTTKLLGSLTAPSADRDPPERM